ncbi:MAG TPA: aldo/keto reductase [Kofleriaceae bacterium]|jgi:aryl-alcohol dehydrogenase-like predicted oxidoreductase
MRYNRLGNTGLFVSELCLGTMTFGGSGDFAAIGDVQQSEADRIVARAVDAGINFIDTADRYSDGRSEQIVGQSLRSLGIPRESVVVATKVFGRMGPGPNEGGSSRGHISNAVKASLRRLQLDYIDLYQLHGFDPATPIEESLDALTDLVRQGHVRYVGVSNWAAWQIAKALGLSALHNVARIASVQAYYSLIGRELEREIVPLAESEGVGVLVWSPLAGGLLSGKVRRDAVAAEGTRRAAFSFPPVEMDRAHAVIDVLHSLAAAKGATVAQLAIAWLLQRKAVASVLLGAKRLDQLEDNLSAVGVTFDADELAQLDEVSKLPLEYPGWMIDMWSADRAKQLAGSRT